MEVGISFGKRKKNTSLLRMELREKELEIKYLIDKLRISPIYQ
jgi:hypothetical protein